MTLDEAIEHSEEMAKIHCVLKNKYNQKCAEEHRQLAEWLKDYKRLLAIESGIDDDLISRQDALNMIRALQTYKLFEGDDMILVDKADVQTELMMLPSAEPELIRCKDCKYWTHIKRTNRYWCKTDDGLFDPNPSPDDFCSRAERRTE